MSLRSLDHAITAGDLILLDTSTIDTCRWKLGEVSSFVMAVTYLEDHLPFP